MLNKKKAKELLREHKKMKKNERVNDNVVELSDAETVRYSDNNSDVETIQYAEPVRQRSNFSNQCRLKAKKKRLSKH